MTKLVVCKVSIPGFHKWDEAFKEVDYLKNKHRHVFEITVGFQVINNNREVEIIRMQNKIANYLILKFGVADCLECDFGNMSCEDIAEDLLIHFRAYYVTVTEDGYGGSTLIDN